MREFLKQPGIFNRDDSLVGEGFKQLNLSLCERTNFSSTNINSADGHAFAKQRRREYRAKAQCYSTGTWKFSRGCLKVMDMDRLAVDNRSTRDRATIRDTALAQGRRRGDRSKVSDAASDFAIYTPHYRVGCVTESRSSLGNRIEYRLKISWRAGDHPQDIARSRLPCERLVEGALQ